MYFIRSYKWLAPSLFFSVLLVAGRVIYTGNLTFLFMVWNMFLGIVPLYMAWRLEYAETKLRGWIFAITWLLFFPNAMYIVTDLFHLKSRGDIPLWYDLLLILSCALNGIIMGFCSLYRIERWLNGYLGKISLQVAIFFLLLLCGYGVYLGRYERWNSWDVLVDPASLCLDIVNDVIHPFRNINIWTLSFVFAIWMYLLYRYFPRNGTGKLYGAADEE